MRFSLSFLLARAENPYLSAPADYALPENTKQKKPSKSWSPEKILYLGGKKKKN